MADSSIPEKTPQQSLASALAELGDKATELDKLQDELTIYFQDTYRVQMYKVGNGWSVNKENNWGNAGERASYWSYSFIDCVLWVLNEYSKGTRDE